MVRPLLLEAARLVVMHRGVIADLVPALVVNAKKGPRRKRVQDWRYSLIRFGHPKWEGFVLVELGLQDGESYDWRYWQLSAEHHHPSGLMPWQ